MEDSQIVSVELKGHFLRLYRMALADDNFDKLELKMLYEFAAARGIDEIQLTKILLSPSEEQPLPVTVSERVSYLYDLALMIWADGKVTLDEKNALRKYCVKFEFEDKNIDEIMDFLLDSAEKKLSKTEILNQL